MKILSKSLADTCKAAQDFLAEISKIKSNHAVIIGLFGDLGSGKTTFTQALGQCLNIKEVMTSPTFVIMKSYVIDQNLTTKIPFTTLVHIDAYRLESGHELAVLSFAELARNPKNLIIIEWPERVADILPPDLLKINFKFISETEREIDLY
jgi:tRNA threonylcarbamoyladenosine biosynthesis protein TsaE